LTSGTPFGELPESEGGYIIVDINQLGFPDILFISDGNLLVQYAEYDADAPPTKLFSLAEMGQYVRFIDVHGDGGVDIVRFNQAGQPEYSSRGVGPWRLLMGNKTPSLIPADVSFVHIDFDGIIDVVAVDRDLIWSLYSSSSDSWRAVRDTRSSNFYRLDTLLLADFNGDGLTDAIDPTPGAWRGLQLGTVGRIIE